MCMPAQPDTQLSSAANHQESSPIDLAQWVQIAALPPKPHPEMGTRMLHFAALWLDQHKEMLRTQASLLPLAPEEMLLIEGQIQCTHNALALATLLQHDLSRSLGCDIFVAYSFGSIPENHSDLLLAAQAARLMNKTEPLLYRGRERLQALQRFRLGLQEQRLIFEFQPIARLDTLDLCGYEMLARLREGSHLVPAGQWIGYIVYSHDSIWLTRYALQSAAQRLLEQPGDTYLSINLTPLSFFDPDLFAQAQALPSSLRHHLVLELTEWQNPLLYDGLHKRLEQARSLGLKIAIDDFGAGYSSTEVLRSVDFDIIKLDINLMKSGRASDLSLIEWTLNYARHHGARVVAEGIENDDALQMARRTGVEYGQGWHLDRLLLSACAQPAQAGGHTSAPAFACS